MLACLLSVTVLCLFPDGSHAFAPSKSKAPSTTFRFAAGNELSSVLSDYSSSAAAEATSVTANTVREAVSSAVTTQVPPSTPSLAAFIKNEASVIDATRVAQDAADRATAAAGAATKAAAAVGGSVSESVVGKIQFSSAGATKLPFQVDASKVNVESSYDAIARSKDNLDTMKANILGGFESLSGNYESLKGSTGSLDKPFPKFDSVSITPAIDNIIRYLHLKEYGGWYAVAAMAFFASLQRSAGAKEANAKFESELISARKKASEAAIAAGLAAEGANTAKALALKMEKDMNIDGSGESTQSKHFKMENDILRERMLALQTEVSSLQSELASYKKLRTNGTATDTKKGNTESEKAKVKAEERNKDSTVTALLTEEKKTSAAVEDKSAAEAKSATAEKKSRIKGGETKQTKTKLVRKKSTTKKVSNKAKMGAKKIAATKTKADIPTKKKVVKKSSRTSVPIENWALLAESTLKRKTVAQLTEYLAEKGVPAANDSGKSLKKAELLEAVKSLGE